MQHIHIFSHTQKQSEIEEKLNSVTVPRASLGQKGKLESERRVLQKGFGSRKMISHNCGL